MLEKKGSKEINFINCLKQLYQVLIRTPFLQWTQIDYGFSPPKVLKGQINELFSELYGMHHFWRKKHLCLPLVQKAHPLYRKRYIQQHGYSWQQVFLAAYWTIVVLQKRKYVTVEDIKQLCRKIYSTCFPFNQIYEDLFPENLVNMGIDRLDFGNVERFKVGKVIKSKASFMSYLKKSLSLATIKELAAVTKERLVFQYRISDASANAMNQALSKHGLSLGVKIAEWSPPEYALHL